jgi:tRNA (cytidine32/uridine32-2'-O)-methyltransferase
VDDPAPEGAHGDESARRVLREGIVVVLVRPLQSGNVGATARAMKNMGLRRLAVVSPPAFDLDRARWMAPGAEELLNEAAYVGTVAEAVAGCRFVIAATARRRHSPWPTMEAGGCAVRCFEGDGPVALLFGPEDHGLANDEIAHAHALVHLATDAHASLNVAQAVLLLGSAIHGEARARGFVPRVEGPGRRGGPGRGAAPVPADARQAVPLGDVEPLVGEWLDTLELSTYLVGHEPLLVQSTLRRILQRAALDAGEVAILRGQLRKLRWKMQN